MDRDFIARNQVVERYLSGRLPLKGATEFERFCRENPDVLDELGLAERVNAGLRLLDASGKPEPWQEAKKPFWQKPQVSLGLTAAVIGLGIALSVVLSDSATKTQRITKLQSQAVERPLDPATSTRVIRLVPSRIVRQGTDERDPRRLGDPLVLVLDADHHFRAGALVGNCTDRDAVQVVDAVVDEHFG